MSIFLLSFVIFALVAFGMSLGVILNKRELKGSCGGLGNIPGVSSDCSCSKPCEKKKARLQQEASGLKPGESSIEFRK
ncbi:MAG: hypothetical protein CSB47_05585 [Proteobacteria bacterium]|nr:MAG: hypothetical protein CSB47_05585 [Pseudomonadota bacterium]